MYWPLYVLFLLWTIGLESQICVDNGACCQGAFCIQQSAALCALQGGFFQGIGTGCSCQNCTQLFDCCSRNGLQNSCFSQFTEYTCTVELGGTVLPLATCSNLNCPSNPCQ